MPIFFLILSLSTPLKNYEYEKRQVTTLKSDSKNWSATKTEDALTKRVITISNYWLGMKWQLGRGQATHPSDDYVNCGSFVGNVLRDAGFNVNVDKLQKQYSQHIIQSFSGKNGLRKFSKAPIERFMKAMKNMGKGLYIIGLDYHVGFILHTGSDIRFIHSSYEKGVVVNEDAATALPIVSSEYRVVGKILSKSTIKKWRSGAAIEIVGDVNE